MSVRKFEELVKAYRNPKNKEKQMQSLELKDLVEHMQRTFATKVSVLGNDKRGRIYIDYYNRDDLDRIADILELVDSQTKNNNPLTLLLSGTSITACRFLVMQFL